jgi:dipeptidase E
MRLLLISSSTVHGYGYLDHPESEMKSFLGERKKVAFVPFAIQDHDAYATKVRERLGRMGLDVTQVRSWADLEGAEAIFVGGGNTFRLLKSLQDLDLLRLMRERVRTGLPYIGSSAGSNIAAPTIKTTNDMPIVQPSSFEALGLVNFQINPHFLDADPSSTHMGETREQRLIEYLEENETPVVAIREGSMLRVEDGVTTVLGLRPARIYEREKTPREVEPGGVIGL